MRHPLVRRKSTKGRETRWRNKRGGSKKSNSDENALRNSLFHPSFFTSTFLRVANRVKADVLETKFDPSDPLAIRIPLYTKARKPLAVPSNSPAMLRATMLYYYLKQFDSLQFGFLRYLLNSANLIVTPYYNPTGTYKQGERTKF